MDHPPIINVTNKTMSPSPGDLDLMEYMGGYIRINPMNEMVPNPIPEDFIMCWDSERNITRSFSYDSICCCWNGLIKMMSAQKWSISWFLIYSRTWRTWTCKMCWTSTSHYNNAAHNSPQLSHCWTLWYFNGSTQESTHLGWVWLSSSWWGMNCLNCW